MSSKPAMPVEMITGFPLETTFSVSGMSVISGDAILYAGTLSFSKRSTAVLSNGLLKHISPSSFAA